MVGEGMAEAIGDAEGIEGMDGIEGIAGMLGETAGAGGAVGTVCAVATPVAASAIVLPARTMPINQRFTMSPSERVSKGAVHRLPKPARSNLPAAQTRPAAPGHAAQEGEKRQPSPQLP